MIPVVLFAYGRPNHLRRTLSCLETDRVPLIYAFSDAAAGPERVTAVAEVRQILRSIDWCDLVLCERDENMGLGRSILTGVSDVLSVHDAALVVEDDLECVPGTFAYLSAALAHYADDPRVMSVTGWTHPRITPQDLDHQPWFDARAESWYWGTWRRAWDGMRDDATTLLQRCEAAGIDVYRCGADVPVMAKMERDRNTWAVRFLCWQMLNRGVCLRPPWSMVEHIGFDAEATNATVPTWYENGPLADVPPLPLEWPEPVEHPDCVRLARAAYGSPESRRASIERRVLRRVKRLTRSVARTVHFPELSAKADGGRSR